MFAAHPYQSRRVGMAIPSRSRQLEVLKYRASGELYAPKNPQDEEAEAFRALYKPAWPAGFPDV